MFRIDSPPILGSPILGLLFDVVAVFVIYYGGSPLALVSVLKGLLWGDLPISHTASGPVVDIRLFLSIIVVGRDIARLLVTCMQLQLTR